MGKLLVLENDQTVATLLREVLTRRGHEVEVAGAGEEALAILDQGGVEALITDLFLPGMDGLEVVERLAASGAGVPVVVVSGFIDPAAMARLERSPLVHGWLKKPFDLFDLVEKVESATLALNQGPRMPPGAPVAPPACVSSGVQFGVPEKIFDASGQGFEATP